MYVSVEDFNVTVRKAVKIYPKLKSLKSVPNIIKMMKNIIHPSESLYAGMNTSGELAVVINT